MHVHTATYHPKMSDSPTWQTLAGTFLHRAVLHPGGKWRYVNTQETRDEYLDHSRRLALAAHAGWALALVAGTAGALLAGGNRREN